MPNETAIAAAKSFILSLPVEEQKSFDGLSQAGLEYVGQGVLRQQDYTQKTTELKSKHTELNTWREKAEGQFNNMMEDNVKLKSKVTETEARMQAIADKYGISKDELKLQQQATGQSADAAAQSVQNQGGQAVTSGQAGSTFDPKDLQRYADNSAETAVSIVAKATDLANEHKELFGKSIKVSEFLAEAAKSGKGLEEYWTEKYDVEAKRRELSDNRQKDYEEKLKEEARQEERAKMIDSGYQPGHSVNLNSSPLFDPRFGTETTKSEEQHFGKNDPNSAKRQIEGVLSASRAFELEGVKRIADAHARGEM